MWISSGRTKADPAAVVFDAIAAAKARGSDAIICDTAGRLHNKQNLMNELGKISRILSRELPDAAKEVLLVLDGTTGQNGLLQAKQFQEIAGVTGIVLTKLDGTAKGGIVIAVADALQIPVKCTSASAGSCLVEMGDTVVLCNASVEEKSCRRMSDPAAGSRRNIRCSRARTASGASATSPS